jgi:hypothetical protein
MKKYITFILIFAIIGLVFGYLMFGKFAGDYISLNTIFSSSENAIEQFGRNISGLSTIKQNILISGAAGALLGFIVVFIRRK